MTAKSEDKEAGMAALDQTQVKEGVDQETVDAWCAKQEKFRARVA